MVAEITENPVTTEAPLELPETPLEPVEFTPSETDAEPNTELGDETPVDSDDAEEELVPAVPTVESALEKRRGIDRGDTDISLSADEFRLLREHDRAEDNRRRDFERTEGERKQQIEAVQKEFETAKVTVADEVVRLSDMVTRLGNDPVVLETVQSRITALMDGLKGNAEKIILDPHLERQRDQLRSAYGENPATDTLRSISGLKSQDQILSWTYEMGRSLGQTEGAPEGMVLVPKSDHDRWTKAEKTAAKAGNGDAVPPVNRPTARDSRSDAEILMDPSTPVDKLIEIRTRQRGG